jgi:hypothetical protein
MTNIKMINNWVTSYNQFKVFYMMVYKVNRINNIIRLEEELMCNIFKVNYHLGIILIYLRINNMKKDNNQLIFYNL